MCIAQQQTPFTLPMNTQLGNRTSQENDVPTNKMEACRGQRTKQRKVLGVLNENELPSRSLNQESQLSKPSSFSDSSQAAFLSCPSSSSFNIHVIEPCEVVLTASGEMVNPEPLLLDEDAAVLQHKDFGLFLDLAASSCADSSMQSLPDESLLQDTLHLSEYVEEVHQHLRESELKFRLKPDFIMHHPDIDNRMRIVLVDWLAEVSQEYKLHGETLYLAVNYLDRFLSQTMSVKRGKLQLVGTAAILLAAKYEEVFPPELDEFVYITDDTYTRRQLIRMEYLLLKVLAFNLTVPTTQQFLGLFLVVQSVCSKTENLALYVAELSLLEMDLLVRYIPSMVAAAAYCLANYTINKAQWPGALQDFTGYTMAEIVPCLKQLHKLHLAAESHPQQAIRIKYKRLKGGC
ncbi:cyclin-A1 [Lampris incognitus]|uniref:cyclin-A1 n=1 Tax=Lampris incognitus TaxID=2546036 RepID=UPI0024B60866|nr:cyclin-A1 [Lampris incognitus]